MNTVPYLLAAILALLVLLFLWLVAGRKSISYLLAAILALLGFIFLTGSQGQIIRLLIGIVLFVAAGAVIYLSRSKPQVTQNTVVQQIDLSGDVNLETMKCKVCGAPLAKDSLEVKAGAIFVTCSHCGSTYQFEEEPKW